MNSIKKFFLRIAGLHVEKQDVSVLTPKGVLFGLDPPPGHYFDVALHSGSTPAWFVEIWNKETGKKVVSKLSLIYGNSEETDEALIKKTALLALQTFAAAEKRNHLIGQYPPKSTS